MESLQSQYYLAWNIKLQWQQTEHYFIERQLVYQFYILTQIQTMKLEKAKSSHALNAHVLLFSHHAIATLLEIAIMLS